MARIKDISKREARLERRIRGFEALKGKNGQYTKPGSLSK